MPNKYRDYVIECADQRDIDNRRNQFKAQMKHEMLFLRCELNTVILKNRSRYTFVIKGDVPDIDDESLPPEAFRETVRGI